jgi:hypothetical protein
MKHLEVMFDAVADVREKIKKNSTETNLDDLADFNEAMSRNINDITEKEDKKEYASVVKKVINEVKTVVRTETGLVVKKKGKHTYEATAPTKRPAAGIHTGHPPPSTTASSSSLVTPVLDKALENQCKAELKEMIAKYDHHMVANALVDILKDM